MESALIRRLRLIIEQVNKLKQEGESLLANENENLKATTIKLESAIERFSRELIEYFKLCTEPSADEISQFTEAQLQAEEILGDLKAKLSTSPKGGCSHEYTASKLPKLSVPEFKGDILEWHAFWDKFNSSIHSRNLADVDKFLYLKTSLKEDALKVVEGLDTTTKNYAIAVSLLKEKYGTATKVIDAHYSALYKLKASDTSIKESRKILDAIERHLRVLGSLGEDNCHSHLRFLILEKFPEEIVYEVKKKIKDDTIQELRKQLESIISSREDARRLTQTEEEPVISTGALQINAIPVRKRQNTRVTKPDMTKRPRLYCYFCEEAHLSQDCTKYKTVMQRKQQMGLGRNCFRCLRRGHFARTCMSSGVCKHCKGAHHIAICHNKNNDINPKEKEVEKSKMPIDVDDKISVNTVFNSNHNIPYLQTATAQAINRNEVIPCRILLDCGSQRSYITQRLYKLLKLKPIREDILMIYTFGENKPKETHSPAAEITITTKRGITKRLTVNIVPHITDRLPIPELDDTSMIDIVADDGSANDHVDILIGNDYYCSCMRQGCIKIDNYLHLIDSDFGWIVSGRLDIDNRDTINTLSVATYHQVNYGYTYQTKPDPPLNMDIKFLWSLESIGITDSNKTTREEEAVQYFNETVEYKNKRYHVKWPWTAYPPDIPTNYGVAYGRLKGLLHRLDLLTLQEYDDIIKEQLNLDIIEVANAPPDLTLQSVPPIHYLPHHVVKQDGKRGRIVYDASAKIKDQLSLNECMYRGPCMLQDLTALLLNFRLNKIGIIADVEKAFLQIGLQPEAREVTRFLWVKNINEPLSNENIVHMRFQRVPFGIIASPFLLTAVIHYHISKTNNQLLEHIANKCYVDNLVTGSQSSEEGFQLYETTKKIFQEMSMNIRDWTSNDENLVDLIPESSRAKPEEEVKVLGLTWNKKTDTLRLNTKEFLVSKTEIVTKRKVLARIASVYDPCGITSPLLLPAKLFLRELWKQDYKWDTPLLENHTNEWGKIVDDLAIIKEVKIPRYASIPDVGTKTEYELHCFSDASKSAYAAAAYLRTDNGQIIKTTLLMSKNRLVPLEKTKTNKEDTNVKKPLTIPQLELLGYVIGSRLINYLTKHLKLNISKQYLWTDSLIVLNWIKSNKLLTPWVTNRVNEIKRNPNLQTCYINSKLNPADLATRPELWWQKQQLWLQGPGFLSTKKDMWPKDTDMEYHTILASVGEGLEGQPLEDEPGVQNQLLETRFDSRDVSDASLEDQPLEGEQGKQNRISKIIEDNQEVNDTRERNERMTQEINYRESEVLKIKSLQSEYFPEEVKGVKTNLMRNLGLFKDIDGVLRCGGRMLHTDWSYDTKHPILIPKNCEFTEQIIKETHERYYHVGVSHTLSIIRQHYWIPQGRQQVKKILRRCSECVRHGGGPYKLPATPALPPERVRYEAPFAFTGMDYFGPIFVKTESGKEKRWGCLFTCLVVRSIHLEVVRDMTADECLLAVRRFAASRGAPTLVLSDNALQFKLTAEVMSNTFCIENKIRWKFIPELAPWHGGVYERLVSVVKHCMKRTLGKHLLNDTQLLTVMKEIEAIVNTRPLTCVSAEPELILKPADFLSLGKCIMIQDIPETDNQEGTSTKRNLITSWRRGITMLNEFKEMFIGQYLLNLRERYQHSHKEPRIRTDKEPCVGDLVQIKGEAKNRLNWKVGRISRLIRGTDGECRVAKVKVGDTEFTRSICHLYPLEADIQEELEKGADPTLNVNPQDIMEICKNSEQGEVMGTNGESNDLGLDIDKLTDKGFPSEEAEQLMEIDTDDQNINSNNVAEELCDNIETLTEDEMNREKEEGNDMQIQERRSRRDAAVRAREKIAEWTRQLVTLL